ncbi:NAD(P)H-dependent oxidoreductase [Aestuariivita sp.]|jgi:putative NADPH-quinone reductase|uniref:NAD(P)H-dependent oxidoreductase n=1 Tax=Aestuariivita sp. TaxID=1872407 RepID=UPI002170651F|nr:NAD(P)H-dependent oxidoreductase [Aestuariivita sp.]MCE8008669.1 flavodoxin family protein [Aestuariivita sp.]
MSRALVLFAHPCEESFSQALYETTCEALTGAGWEVDALDLYKDGFDPVMTASERRAYHDQDSNTAPVADYTVRLQAAEALVMVFPVWNFGYPAILKGFIDRVFLPGVSFVLQDGLLQPKLHNIKRLAAVTTYGGTRMRALMCGDPPRKSVTRHIRAVLHPGARTRYMALYDMNRATEIERRNFRRLVAQQLGRL